jgi:hypothetical protein
MTRLHQALAIAAVALLYGASAAPYTSDLVDQICPIDGEKFKAELAMSGTTFGRHLDLKPYGAIVSPWPMAKCPTSGFVIYRDDFSKDELRQLRSIVKTDEYRQLQARETPYYLAAWLQRALGNTAAESRYTLLEATWEAKDVDTYLRYASEALQAYELALPALEPSSEQWWTAQLVAGELERRTSRFEDADRRFRILAALPEDKNPTYKAIIELQLRLIAAKDVETHEIPRPE